MPQVPGSENNSPQFAHDVPGIQFPYRGEFGRQGAAVEKLGQGVEQGSRGIAELGAEVQRQNDIATSSKAHVDEALSADQQVEVLKVSSPDGFVRDDTTGEVVKNSDGSQQTIAQKYWEDANNRYLSAQENMTPGAAAMFREKMLPEIGRNYQQLQMHGLLLQSKASESAVSGMKDTISKGFQQNFVPTDNAYYTGPAKGEGQGTGGAFNPNSAQMQYPSAQKFFDGLQKVLLTREQMGPIQGKPGSWGPTQLAKLKQNDGNELAENWINSGLTDLMSSAGSRAALHSQQKDASSTAFMGAKAILAVVNGQDPQSLARASVGLPTVNSSLNQQQIKDFNAKILGMFPAAHNVDKAEYELQKQQLSDLAHGTKNIDQFFRSALFNKTMLAQSSLGMGADERAKEFAPIIGQAITSAAIAAAGGLNSPDAKKAAAVRIMQDASKRWPQFAGMLGVKDTTGFGEAITAKIPQEVDAKLKEEAAAQNRDPMAHAAQPSNWNDSPMTHAVDTALNIRTNPSPLGIFNKMGNGRSIIQNAQEEAARVFSRGLSPHADIRPLSIPQAENEKEKLISSRNPDVIETYFEKLAQSGLSKSQQQAFQNQLVVDGKMPQPYIDALSLKTPLERKAAWQALLSGDADSQALATKNSGAVSLLNQKQLAQKNNAALFQNIDSEFGPGSVQASDKKKQYTQSWIQSFAKFKNQNLSDSEAAKEANRERDKTVNSYGTVGAQHDFWLFNTASGPQIPVNYGRPAAEIPEDKRKNINANLSNAMSAANLSKLNLADFPGYTDQSKNPNAPSKAEWLAAHAKMWERNNTNDGYRLTVSELSPRGNPTGEKQFVWISDGHGGKRPLVISDTEAEAPPKVVK